MMLCGAFPMVWLIKRYLAGPSQKLGGLVGLSSYAAAGLLAGLCCGGRCSKPFFQLMERGGRLNSGLLSDETGVVLPLAEDSHDDDACACFRDSVEKHVVR